MSGDESAINVAGVRHAYGERLALKDVSFSVRKGEIFGLLGPNGGGKTTLFRLLSTLLSPQQGEIHVAGCDVRRERQQARRRLGVVFQAPSLDKKLTVSENLWHQAALYGVRGELYRRRSSELLAALGLTDRAADRVEGLSGGLRRRVELAKGMLHHPEVLLLDEPSTGLDPGARLDLWDYLRRLRELAGTTIVLTTHLLEEADKADRLGILAAGSLVALDTPAVLRSAVGGDTLSIATATPDRLAGEIRQQCALTVRVVDGVVRLELADAGTWVPRLMSQFSADIASITLGKPTLEDVFIARTGHRFRAGGADERG